MANGDTISGNFWVRLDQTGSNLSKLDQNVSSWIKLDFLPTVNVVQAEDCLHMAIQSRVTEVSSWVTRPRTLHSEASHITVVPDVFS